MHEEKTRRLTENLIFAVRTMNSKLSQYSVSALLLNLLSIYKSQENAQIYRKTYLRNAVLVEKGQTNSFRP